jgi:ABC-2 type transport system ATP-binding protein
MSQTGATVLETVGLCKSYGSVQAVRELSLRVRAGEIYGFLGLNGAGKTTSIRMMLGLIRPDAGTVRLFGRNLHEAPAAILKRIGCLVETATAYPNLTVRENLDLQRRLVGAPAAAVGEMIGLLGLGEYARRPAGVLSLGNKQRLALARALLARPEFLILDEPVNGLDPAGIAEIRELLRGLAKERGTAILMSSHLLDEVEQLADRIGIIHRGRLIDEFDSGALAGRLEPALELEVDDAARARQVLASRFPEAPLDAAGPSALRLRGAAIDPAAAAKALVEAGIGLRRLSPARPDLETLFLDLTAGGLK